MEKVEANHFARYNERFILEHNKSEAERSANLLNIDDVGSTTTNGITYSIKDGVITLNGTATDNVLIKALCDIKANQSYYLKIFDSPIKLRCYYSNDVNTSFGTLLKSTNTGLSSARNFLSSTVSLRNIFPIIFDEYKILIFDLSSLF